MGFEHTDTGKIPIAFSKIEAVAHNKFIRNLKPDEVGIEFHFPSADLIQQHTGAETGRMEFFDEPYDHRNGFPRVENIVDEEDMSV